MPSLDINFLKQLKTSYTNFTIFVETGTLNGSTIFAMEPYFNSLYTIELSELFYNKTKKKYNGDKINFILGDSSVVLQDLVPKLKGNIIFFLDGHWSCGRTARGPKDCPLYEEIECIMNSLESECIIIIDDFRLFGKGPNNSNEKVNWETITKTDILEMCSSRLKEEYHLPSDLANNDRWIIHLNSM